MLLRSALLRLRRSAAGSIAGALSLSALVALAACNGGGTETASATASDSDATGTDATTGSSTSTGTTASTTGTTASETEGTDSDTSGGELEPPDLSCPGDPSGNCDEVPGAQLEAGAAVISILPNCWEKWIDVDGNAKFEATKDELLDCGCDQICPDDLGYEGPDEGEGDNQLQAVWLAGFGNGRAANGIRDTSMGLVGDDDGWWARAVVLEQGNTAVAIVVIDTIGYFNDEVVEIREMLAELGLKIDHVIVQGIHNHEGPDTMGMWGKEFLQPGYNEAYGAQVREAIVEAIAAARKDKRPVSAMVVGEVDISTYHENGVANVIRDSRDPWVVDETMSAARLVDVNDETIVTLINYGCHPETLADDNLLITSDFSHALRRTVEKGSVWQSAPGKEGLGGPAIYINAAVGGMMTTLGVEVVNPDGDSYKSASFEKADSIGQLLGEMALDAIDLGDVVDAPKLSVANRTFKVDVLNTSFQFLFDQGVLKRTTYPPEDGGDTMRIQTEMSVINLGPIQMLSVPGEILPELTIGGYDGSRVNAPGVPLIDPNNTNPPDVDAAPQGPYIKDRMGGTYRWIIGLGNDELGYIIPDYDYQLADTMPYVDEAEGDHYEETNSLGPHIAGIVDDYAAYLTAWSAQALGQ
ncbi:MAG: hypothetical protein KC486_25535 [Myxococcales bacterium]|nr:hypothetical protein [Myxococcales bacterium]